MRRRRVWLILGAAVLIGGGVLYFVVLRPEPVSDRQQILQLIADVERAVEQQRVSALMAHISEDYEDSHGYNRRTVQRLVVAAARDARTMDLSVQCPEISVQGDTASFVAEVDYSLDSTVERGSTTHLTVRGWLRREGRRWRVVRAEGWQGAGASLL